MDCPRTEPTDDQPLLESRFTRSLRREVYRNAEERVCHSIVRSGLSYEKVANAERYILHGKLSTFWGQTV